MLGQDVARAAQRAAHEAIALDRSALDVTDPGSVRAALRSARPDVVVNCAAFTDVDGAEAHEREATAVNATGAGAVARCAHELGAWTIHISTDYVFDGTARQAYVESDPTAPASAYGRSKLAGEREVAAGAPDAHTIVRTSWLFGLGGRCFPATIRRLCQERDEITVVDDQVGCPTFTGHLASALMHLADTRPRGVVHLAGAGSCSWYEFARAIVAGVGGDCEVLPCTTAQFPRPAPRPAFSVLGTDRADELTPMPSWQDGLSAYLSAEVARA